LLVGHGDVGIDRERLEIVVDGELVLLLKEAGVAELLE